MYPILFRIGDFTVTSYGVMLVVAFVGAGFVVASEFKRRGWDTSATQDIVLAAMVGGIVGSKLWWALANFSELAADPIGTLFSRGGFTFYGGLIGGVLTVIAYLRWKKYPMGQAVNSLALAVPVGYMLGRVGCLLVGDDYGFETDVPWAIAFPEGSPPTTAPVHPTQIYEILLTLPIFLLLWSLRDRDLPDYFLFFLFFMLAGLERFIVEFYRVNEAIAFDLTAAQWASVGFIVVGAVGLWRSTDTRGSLSSETPAPA